MNLIGEEQISSLHFEDLINMIRNAEKSRLAFFVSLALRLVLLSMCSGLLMFGYMLDVLLLNQARIRALEDLEKILLEKEALQREINNLELKLAETDAGIKVLTQDKIHVELLQDQLEKMRKEFSKRSDAEGVFEISDVEDVQSLDSDFYCPSKELSALQAENASLNNDIKALRAELSSVSIPDGRVTSLEKERLDLQSTVKDLQSKLAASEENVTELSTLKNEYNSLCEKVQNLQSLLDTAANQAGQAIPVLQQNQELRKKVESLEESLAEANFYKLSSEKMQQYNELMQQKIKVLEERLERSDEEISSYVQMYQESMKEFQDTLNNLKKSESGRAVDGPVDDMPWEFWSQMLLMIDGWLLEKKLTSIDAKILREMVWKRERCIYDAYLECKEKTEREMLATFLSLTAAPTQYVSHCPKK